MGKLAQRVSLKKTCTAFSLVEISLVLCIIGILSAYAIPAFLNANQIAKVVETDKKLEGIVYALASYAVNNGCLPNAARPLTHGSNEAKDGAGVDDLLYGIVPYQDLGLQESDVRDGFGHFITYAIPVGVQACYKDPVASNRLVVNTPGLQKNPKFCKIDPMRFQRIRVESINGQAKVWAGDPRDFVAFVLISHGKSGGGAFDYQGNRIPTQSREKGINAENSVVFIDGPKSEIFDDRVKWITRNNLMAIYAKTPCIHDTYS
jgi:type II secretory pathway pseudopilin PulG